MSIDETLLYRLAISLGLGLIVGLERGWKTRKEHAGLRVAGARTFAMTSLMGGVLAAVAHPTGFIVLAAGLVILGALVTGAYLVTTPGSQDFGLTTEIALLTTFGLGAASVWGYPFQAASMAVAMTLLLGLKAEVHRLIRGLQRDELMATLQLLLIAVVLVPLLPARYMGPWQAVNPRTIGLFVLLIAGLSYVGYFAVRVLGSRLGLMLTAFFGGLSSSTAVTVAYAQRSRASASFRPLLGAGIALAAATMVPRLCVEIAAVNGSLLPNLLPPLVVLALVPLALVVIAGLYTSKTPEHSELALGNPLQLRAALIFGIALSGLFIAIEALQRSMGDSGIYMVAALAGLADVDAIALSLAQAAGRTVPQPTAERAILLAALVNTGVKAVLAGLIGGRPMTRWASSTLAVALFAAAVTAWLTAG